MIKEVNRVWNTDSAQQLARVMTSISDKADMQNFLRDVMTEKEIVEISARLEAARMLTNGEKYKEITKQTKLSSRTVARINDWLKNGCKGYPVALNLVEASHYAHILPARAE